MGGGNYRDPLPQLGIQSGQPAVPRRHSAGAGGHGTVIDSVWTYLDTTEERLTAGAQWPETELVFITASGGFLQPRNIDRMFHSHPA